MRMILIIGPTMDKSKSYLLLDLFFFMIMLVDWLWFGLGPSQVQTVTQLNFTSSPEPGSMSNSKSYHIETTRFKEVENLF